MTCFHWPATIYSLYIWIIWYFNSAEPDMIKKVAFDEIWPQSLLAFMIIFMQAAVPLTSCWDYNVFIVSILFCVSRYIIVTSIEHTVFFNYVPNGSIFLNINDCCGRSPWAVVQKCISLIDSYSVFSIPETIFLREFLNLTMITFTIQKVYIPFSDGDIKEHVQEATT